MIEKNIIVIEKEKFPGKRMTMKFDSYSTYLEFFMQHAISILECYDGTKYIVCLKNKNE